jgi:hypothetical protein
MPDDQKIIEGTRKIGNKITASSPLKKKGLRALYKPTKPMNDK